MKSLIIPALALVGMVMVLAMIDEDVQRPRRPYIINSMELDGSIKLPSLEGGFLR